MTAVCELTKKAGQYGNNVSHSQRKTRRKFEPNLQNVSFYSSLLKSNLRFRVSTRAIKTVDKYCGIDDFLLKANNTNLSTEAVKVKKALLKLSSSNTSTANTCK